MHVHYEINFRSLNNDGITAQHTCDLRIWEDTIKSRVCCSVVRCDMKCVNFVKKCCISLPFSSDVLPCRRTGNGLPQSHRRCARLPRGQPSEAVRRVQLGTAQVPPCEIWLTRLRMPFQSAQSAAFGHPVRCLQEHAPVAAPDPAQHLHRALHGRPGGERHRSCGLPLFRAPLRPSRARRATLRTSPRQPPTDCFSAEVRPSRGWIFDLVRLVSSNNHFCPCLFKQPSSPRLLFEQPSLPPSLEQLSTITYLLHHPFNNQLISLMSLKYASNSSLKYTSFKQTSKHLI